MTTFWTPLGLMRFTRLASDTRSESKTVPQSHKPYTRFMTTYLPAGTQEAVVNFQHDFAGFADNDVELVDHFSNFLQMCSDTNIKLNPSKVKVGVREVKFYDYKLTNKAMHPAESNLDPIKKLTTPTNQREVRSLLGLFVQFRQFFKRHDRVVKPIQKLLKKGTKFTWGEEQSKALEQLKKRVMEPDALCKCCKTHNNVGDSIINAMFDGVGGRVKK